MARTAKASARASEPLQTELETAARRLASELGCIMEALPAHARTVRGMSDYLGIDRNICQKVLAASAEKDLRVLLLSPGPKSLYALIDAAKKRGVGTSVVASTRGAVDKFRDLIGRHGSHTSLKNLVARAVDSSSDTPGQFDDERLRRKHFSLTSELMGLQMDARILVTIISPCDTSKGSGLLFRGAQAMVGCTGTGGRGMHTPLIASSRSLADGRHPDTQSFESRLLEQFCSESITLAASRRLSAYAVDAIELPPQGEDQAPVDFVTTTEVFFEANQNDIASRDLTSAGAVQQPARVFILDLFIHKLLVAGRVPTAQTFFWNVNVSDPQCAHRWFDQLPESTRLEVLPGGSPHIDAGVWSRQIELYNYLHAAVGLPPQEFIGYRVQMTYPVTGTQCRIALEPGPTALKSGV